MAAVAERQKSRLKLVSRKCASNHSSIILTIRTRPNSTGLVTATWLPTAQSHKNISAYQLLPVRLKTSRSVKSGNHTDGQCTILPTWATTVAICRASTSALDDHSTVSPVITSFWEWPFNPLKCRLVVSDSYISKCSVPSRSNLHFKFRTFGHSGAQG